MNYTITIGRQLGSGGKQIGEALARRLGFSFYDKELILLASKESGLGKEFFEKADEKTKFSLFSGFFGSYEGGVFSNNYLCSESLFKIQSDVILELAEKQSCVFVGRCADYILRKHPHCLNIFISANEKDRVLRTKNKEHITESKAKSLIEYTDKKRAGYYNYYSNKTWGVASSYDLCVNSSVLGIDGTVELIMNFFTKKFGAVS